MSASNGWASAHDIIGATEESDTSEPSESSDRTDGSFISESMDSEDESRSSSRLGPRKWPYPMATAKKQVLEGMKLLQDHQRSESLVRPERTKTSLAARPCLMDNRFPLLKLPKELRLNVFDQLFTDLTINRQHRPETLHRYHYPSEWPGNDFSAYLHLILTCKEIHNEARGLWETGYIRNCCFYFWKAPIFYRVACALEELGPPYTCAKFVLRGRPFEENGDNETAFVDEDAEDLMMTQPGFPYWDEDYKDHHWGWPKFPFDHPCGEGHLVEGRIPFETYRCGSKRRKCARAFFPALDFCSISVHERSIAEHKFGSRYSQMVGDVGDVFWGAYDPATAHAKLMIYEEWQRRGSPETLLDKASAVLAWKSEAAAGLDKEWLKLNGNIDATFKSIEAGFSLDNWLRERPR